MTRTRRFLGRACASALLAALALTTLPAAAATDATATGLMSTSRMPPGLHPFAALARRPEARPAMEHLISVLDRDAAGPRTFEYGYSVLLGDLSGDGLRDVLIINEELTVSGEGFKTHTTVTAVEGDRGKTLWRREVDLADGFVFPIRGRFGKNANESVILAEVDGIKIGTTGINYVFNALNPHGKKIWTREHSSKIVGDWPFAYVGTDYLVTLDTFDAVPGKATDLLLASGAVVDSLQWQLTSGVVTAAVVDGADGALTPHATPEVGVGIIPRAGAFGDLGGDGLDDYVFVTIKPDVSLGEDEDDPPVTIDPKAGVVDARTGTLGSPLWTASGLRFNAKNILFTNRGDVTGTPAADVFVETNAQWGRPKPNGDYTYMIDGADGTILWRRLGQWPYSPGDIDGDGYPDLMTQTAYSAKGYAASVVWAYTDLGRKLWSKEYRTENPLTQCCTWMFHSGGGSWGTGDVNGDRLEDAFVSNWAWSGVKQTKAVDVVEHFVVSPQRGRVLARGDETLLPLGLPVDAGTADIARVSWVAPGNLLVSVYDTAENELIVSSEIEFPVPVEPKPDVDVTGAYLDGDKCADISVTLRTKLGAYDLAIRGRSGNLMWTHSAGSGQPDLVRATDSNPRCS